MLLENFVEKKNAGSSGIKMSLAFALSFNIFIFYRDERFPEVSLLLRTAHGKSLLGFSLS